MVSMANSCTDGCRQNVEPKTITCGYTGGVVLLVVGAGTGVVTLRVGVIVVVRRCSGVVLEVSVSDRTGAAAAGVAAAVSSYHQGKRKD